jgi:hypothetical protein
MLEFQLVAAVVLSGILGPQLACLEYASALRACDQERMYRSVTIPQIPAKEGRLCSSQQWLRSIIAQEAAEYSLDETCRKRFGKSLDDYFPPGTCITERYLQCWLSGVMNSHSITIPTGVEIPLKDPLPRLKVQRLRFANSKWALTHLPDGDEDDLLTTLDSTLFLNLSFVEAVQFTAFLRSLEARIKGDKRPSLESFDQVKSEFNKLFQRGG